MRGLSAIAQVARGNIQIICCTILQMSFQLQFISLKSSKLQKEKLATYHCNVSQSALPPLWSTMGANLQFSRSQGIDVYDVSSPRAK